MMMLVGGQMELVDAVAVPSLRRFLNPFLWWTRSVPYRSSRSKQRAKRGSFDCRIYGKQTTAARTISDDAADDDEDQSAAMNVAAARPVPTHLLF
jgi:hypothetical protein